MKILKRILWSFAFLALLACSSDGGDVPTISTSDKNFEVFSELFQNFVEQRSTQFSQPSQGLTFTSPEVPCSANPSLKIENQIYSLGLGLCEFAEDVFLEDDIFSISHQASLPNGFRIIVILAFFDMGIPQTGVYRSNPQCIEFCEFNILSVIYVVNEMNEILDFYNTVPGIVEVINNGGVVSASFNAYYFSSDWGGFPASVTVGCCD